MHEDKKLYTTVKIPKSKKKFRLIHIPDPDYMNFLKSQIVDLEKIYLLNVLHQCDHAFVKGRNCVTNASEHIGMKYFLTIDIDSFFDSISIDHLENYIDRSILDLLMIEGCLPQGFPTSPCLSNIAMIRIDSAIFDFIKSEKLDVIYTRYADDLTFSSNDSHSLEKMLSKVLAILRFFNLKINNKKTKRQNLKNGRILVTGVAIYGGDIFPTRKTLKKIRAARHQKNLDSLNGLLEWSLCKKPKVLLGSK